MTLMQTIEPAFKNNAPFRSRTSEINNTVIDILKILILLLWVHNMLEFSDNYFMTSGSLRNFYRNKMNDNAN